ncbi:MAG: protein kinase [Acidobacteriota bacterium]
MVGQTLGHYKILELLGAGGMGEVYRAEDTTLDREVALKILPPELAENQERLYRFQREAKTLAALDHPNIVTIHTVEKAAGIHFITMELVEGKRLSDVIPSEGLPLEYFFDLSIPLADALAEAHELGVIHRDLKPANVMVDRKGRPKILDFGLAKLRHSKDSEHLSQLPTEVMTEEGTVLGTYPYMSPEQAEGRAVDHRSDLFSMGSVLYEMCTGKRPFDGNSPVSLMASILREDPLEDLAAREELPSRLIRILSRCLEKDPDDRFQSARELHKELEELKREEQRKHDEMPQTDLALPRRGASGRRLALAGLVILFAGLLALVLTLRPGREPGSDAVNSITSLAVLPLENLSGDPSRDYFADGLTEALIADLAKISSLRTISRQSVMRYKNSTLQLPEIAQELQVEGFIEGSVQRFGDRVKITVQLIQVRPERHLWGESYESDQTDILKLQGEVSRAIADAVRAQLTPEEQLRLSEARSLDPRAYEAFLKGRYFYNRWPDPDFARCERHFRESIEQQPDFAAAHAGLAACYSVMPWHYPPRDVMPKAREAVQVALEFDPSLGEAWATLGGVELFFDWDWSAAQESYRRAVDLDPNNAWTRIQRMHSFLFVGRFDAAVQEAKRALALDPVSPMMNRGLSFTYWLTRKYDDYEVQAAKTLELAPQNPLARFDLAYAHALQGMREKVQVELGQGGLICGGEILVLATLGELDAAWRRLEAFQQCEAPEAGTYVDAFWIAMVYAVLGKTDESLNWLERAYDERSAMMPQLATNPALDSLRSNPRFKVLLESMDFPES